MSPPIWPLLSHLELGRAQVTEMRADGRQVAALDVRF